MCKALSWRAFWRWMFERKSPLPPFTKGGITQNLPCKGGGTIVPEGLPSPEFVNSLTLINKFCPLTKREGERHKAYRVTPHPSPLTRRKSVIRIIRDVGKAWFPDTLRAGFAIAHTAPYRKSGFTLAEVLITLGIIGVVAAMTLPAVINKYQKVETTTKLKRVYSLLTNATQRAINDYGPSEYWDYPIKEEDESAYLPSSITQDEFFNRYYAPYLKTSKLNQKILGKSYKVHNINGADTGYDNNEVGRGTRFRLNDGMCITMWSNNQYFVFTTDLNCEKPPNILGKDVFDIAELYWEGNKTLQSPPRLARIKNEDDRKEAIEKCKSDDYVSGDATICFAIFVYDGWQFKADYPW